MKLDELIRDPIFQLNLLLWMARDQPADTARVTPLFYRWGYRFLMVEAPLPLPPSLVAAVQKTDMEISLAPEPEMILGNPTNHRAVYLEAKKDSFATQSSTSKQARGHLLAAGPAFREVVTPYEIARLCYVLPEERRALMETCLAELKAELVAHKLSPADTSVHGLEKIPGGVSYGWDDEFAAYVGVETERRVLVLRTEGDDTDPSPLLLVYSAEDYSGGAGPNYAREAMLKQAWAWLLCEVQVSDTGAPLALKTDALLTHTTDGIFNFLGKTRQKNLCRLVRERLFVPIRNQWNKPEQARDDIAVALNGQVLSITLRDDLAKAAFADWLEDAKKMRPDYSSLTTEEPMAFDFDREIP